MDYMKNKWLKIVLYCLLALVLAFFIFFTFASAFDAQFVVELQKEIVKSTSLVTFDVLSFAEWGAIITTIILVALLTIFDEIGYRKELNSK